MVGRINADRFVLVAADFDAVAGRHAFRRSLTISVMRLPVGP